ncbi:hypothetical protein L1765_06100 [Microaerobacter geothermalis]|uniref:hypothetical protein n=1 Tax=Microaerobacter geothermalis TaxID=674972 RepID=UPI001F2CBA92|nr:hypothetical protein [Microaerobacter geothermalis]MCF6093558.1 hypothetical protein [Microaerobacter geothermalis]
MSSHPLFDLLQVYTHHGGPFGCYMKLDPIIRELHPLDSTGVIENHDSFNVDSILSTFELNKTLLIIDLPLTTSLHMAQYIRDRFQAYPILALPKNLNAFLSDENRQELRGLIKEIISNPEFSPSTFTMVLAKEREITPEGLFMEDDMPTHEILQYLKYQKAAYFFQGEIGEDMQRYLRFLQGRGFEVEVYPYLEEGSR